MECIGVGQVNGKQREERICIVHKDNVWGGQSLCRTETRDAAPLEADGEVAKLSEEVDDLALSEPEVKEKAAEINGSAGTPVSPAVPA